MRSPVSTSRAALWAGCGSGVIVRLLKEGKLVGERPNPNSPRGHWIVKSSKDEIVMAVRTWAPKSHGVKRGNIIKTYSPSSAPPPPERPKGLFNGDGANLMEFLNIPVTRRQKLLWLNAKITDEDLDILLTM